jgi:hypothetical protein
MWEEFQVEKERRAELKASLRIIHNPNGDHE